MHLAPASSRTFPRGRCLVMMPKARVSKVVLALAFSVISVFPSLVAGQSPSAEQVAEPLRLDLGGGRGVIEVRKGQEPSDEVERFAQVSRASNGAVFTAAELQSFVDAFCSSGRVTCAKPKMGSPIVLELKGVGTITVNSGQSPGEAIDEFLVKAKARGVSGISEAGVGQVLEYFCARKACHVPLKPVELSVDGMGVVSVGVGEEVATAVERFALAARRSGLPLDLSGVQMIASRLCALKVCTRPVNLPPASVTIEGLGSVTVPFGVEPAVAVEAWAAGVYQAKGFLVELADANSILGNLCGQAACITKVLNPVTVDVGGVGALSVAVGQEPSDAARRFLDRAMKAGHAVDAAGAQGLMEALCRLKKCSSPLNLEAATLAVQGVGTVSVAVGADATAAVTAFLDAARSNGHRLGPKEATQIMEGVCGLKNLAGPCLSPLDVRPVQLEVSGVGNLTVPFGVEPSETVAAFLLDARRQGIYVDAADASAILGRLCSPALGGKACFSALDTTPLRLEVAGIDAPLVVPFNQEPALFVARFCVEARSKGAAVDAKGASALMEAACAKRACLVPLDVSDFSVEVKDVGTFTVAFGQEPATSLLQFVDAVVAAGGGGLVTATNAGRLMEAACAAVTCFAPLDARPVSVPVQGLTEPLVVAFGADPAASVEAFLRSAVASGQVAPEQVNDFAPRLFDAVCALGRSPSKGIAYCHRPLNVRPFTLEVADVGTLTVPFGTPEPARSVLAFVESALDRRIPLDASSVKVLMDRVCSAVPCGGAVIDTRPTNVTVNGIGNLTVPFGAEPSAVARRFLSHATYLGTPVSVDGARTLMEALCSRVRCREPLDLDPFLLPVGGVGTLSVGYDQVPQEAVRAFGNTHRLSPHALQQVLDALCRSVPCEAEIPKPKATDAKK